MNNAQPNYFLVNRQLLDSDRWLSEPFTRGQAWVDLFGLAQHSDGFIRIRGIRIELKRGQLAWSQLSLAKRWKWSRNKTVRYLKELENNGDLKQQNNEITSLITVIKYDYWQGKGSTEGSTERQQKDNRKATEGSHTIKDNNVKNDNNENNITNNYEKIFKIFSRVNPSLNQKDFTQINAAKFLLNEFGEDKTLQMSEYALKIRGEEFAPFISSPLQLKEKITSLELYAKRSKEQLKQEEYDKLSKQFYSR